MSEDTRVEVELASVVAAYRDEGAAWRWHPDWAGKDPKETRGYHTRATTCTVTAGNLGNYARAYLNHTCDVQAIQNLHSRWLGRCPPVYIRVATHARWHGRLAVRVVVPVGDVEAVVAMERCGLYRPDSCVQVTTRNGGPWTHRGIPMETPATCVYLPKGGRARSCQDATELESGTRAVWACIYVAVDAREGVQGPARAV